MFRAQKSRRRIVRRLPAILIPVLVASHLAALGRAVDGVGRLHGPPPPLSPRLKQLIGDRPIDRVEVLSLFGKTLSNDDLVEIGKLYHLKVLCLARTGVTDDGLRHLTTLSDLQELDLSGTKVSEAGLVTLHRMKRLAILRLNDLQISDAAIPSLAKIARLRSLSIRNTRISRDEIGKLRSRHVLVSDGAIEWEAWGVDYPDEQPLRRR
jgi:hypothetical protein